MRQPFGEAARLRAVFLGWLRAGVDVVSREGNQLVGVGGEMVRDGEIGYFLDVEGLHVGHLHGKGRSQWSVWLLVRPFISHSYPPSLTQTGNP